MTPRKHENRRKLKRPVSQNFWWYEVIKPKAFSTYTRAPARETLQITGFGPQNDRGVALCAKSFSGNTPKVRQAARLENLNLDVESIIGRGGNPVGDTPLALAVWEANQFSAVNQDAVRVVEYLISAGADVNRPNRDGRTPLHFPHNLEVVEMLLQAGADVDIQASVDGTTPIYRTDNIRILKLLVPVSSNLNAVDANGKTALDDHMQWAHARSEIIELLHAHGAKKGRVLSGEENGEKDRPQD